MGRNNEDFLAAAGFTPAEQMRAEDSATRGGVAADDMAASLQQSMQQAGSAQARGNALSGLHFQEDGRAFVEHNVGDYIGRHHVDNSDTLRVYHKDFPETVIGHIPIGDLRAKSTRRSQQVRPEHRAEQVARHAEMVRSRFEDVVNTGQGLQTDTSFGDTNPDSYDDLEGYKFK